MNRRHNHENIIVICLFALAVVVVTSMIGPPLYHEVQHLADSLTA